MNAYDKVRSVERMGQQTRPRSLEKAIHESVDLAGKDPSCTVTWKWKDGVVDILDVSIHENESAIDKLPKKMYSGKVPTKEEWERYKAQKGICPVCDEECQCKRDDLATDIRWFREMNDMRHEDHGKDGEE